MSDTEENLTDPVEGEVKAADDDEIPQEPEESAALISDEAEKNKENSAKQKAVVPPLAFNVPMEEVDSDPIIMAQLELIKNSEPETDLEIAMSSTLKRKEVHIARLTVEITKLKGFISKRKQTYKRKRKDEGAPTRALSAYNIFVQERFARLAKENELALQSDDAGARLKRVPPANLVATTGGEWKELSQDDKAKYEVQYVFVIMMCRAVMPFYFLNVSNNSVSDL